MKSIFNRKPLSEEDIAEVISNLDKDILHGFYGEFVVERRVGENFIKVRGMIYKKTGIFVKDPSRFIDHVVGEIAYRSFNSFVVLQKRKISKNKKSE